MNYYTQQIIKETTNVIKMLNHLMQLLTVDMNCFVIPKEILERINK